MIRAGMTIAEAILQLTKGFRKMMGRDPDGLEKIKIQQEAVKRLEDMNKVVDMQGRTLDPSKTVMGGTQEGAALKSGIMKATGTGPKKVVTKGLPDKEFQDLRRSFRMNIVKNSPDFNQDLADRIIKRELYQDLSDTQRKDFLDNLDFVLENPRGEPKIRSMVEDAIDNASLGFVRGDRKYNAQLVAEDLAEKKFGKEFYDLDQKQQIDLYDEALEGLSKQTRDMPDPEDLAQGGRVGLKKGMDRRTFMKIMGGLTTLPILGKFAKGAKLVEPAVKKAAEITAPALDKIIEAVMSAGKLVSQSGRRLKELTTKKKLKGVEVEEDMLDGPSYTIKTKDKTIYYKPGRMDEGGLDDDIIEVIEDTVTKKASGGIARMLGE